LTIPLLKERQMSDLKKARLVLQEMCPGGIVELFYAERKEKNVEFLTVDRLRDLAEFLAALAAIFRTDTVLRLAMPADTYFIQPDSVD